MENRTKALEIFINATRETSSEKINALIFMMKLDSNLAYELASHFLEADTTLEVKSYAAKLLTENLKIILMDYE